MKRTVEWLNRKLDNSVEWTESWARVLTTGPSFFSSHHRMSDLCDVASRMSAQDFDGCEASNSGSNYELDNDWKVPC